MLLKTPEYVDDNVSDDNTIGSSTNGLGIGTLFNYFGEIGEMHLIIVLFIDSQMECVIESEKMASEHSEEIEMVVVGTAPDSISGIKAVENGPEMNTSSPENRSFNPFSAPFHVRGRRPSTGCNKMLTIAEE